MKAALTMRRERQEVYDQAVQICSWRVVPAAAGLALKRG
jgi:hypothetical protein